MTVHGAGNQRVAANVKRLRKQARLNQGDLAQLLTQAGITTIRTVAANLENSLRPITVDELFALAMIFEVDPAGLLVAVCEHCVDNGPTGYTCNLCGRTT